MPNEPLGGRTALSWRLQGSQQPSASIGAINASCTEIISLPKYSQHTLQTSASITSVMLQPLRMIKEKKTNVFKQELG